MLFSRLGSIRQDLAFYSISYYALPAYAETWHVVLYFIMPWAILYLITPWQYPLRLCLIAPWQYLPRVGMQFYVLSTPWQYPPRLYLITPLKYQRQPAARRAAPTLGVQGAGELVKD